MTLLIANPAAGSGKLRRAWRTEIYPFLQRSLGDFGVVFTSGPGDAERITRTALEEGCMLIVAMGGDGTLNEVVNGFFDGNKNISPNAELGILPFGSGGDFIRSTTIPRDYRKATRLLQTGSAHAIDVGCISFINKKNTSRYFVNIANAGLVASIMHRVNAMPRRLPALGRYVTGSLQGFFDYRNIEARITLTDAETKKKISQTVALTNTTIANGRCFGRGMKPAPHAALDDGLFDIFLLKDFATVDFLTLFPQLYLEKKRLSASLYNTYRTSHIRIEPLNKKDSLVVEADGENLGSGAIEISMLKKALKIRM